MESAGPLGYEYSPLSVYPGPYIHCSSMEISNLYKSATLSSASIAVTKVSQCYRESVSSNSVCRE